MIGRRSGAALVLGAAVIVGATAVDSRPDPARSAAPVSLAASPASSSPGPLIALGPTPGDREIAFDLVLDVPGRAALAAYAGSVGDPASPDYRRFLPADEIGARFGLSDADLGRVTGWAAAHGLTVTATSPQRSTVSVVARGRERGEAVRRHVA